MPEILSDAALREAIIVNQIELALAIETFKREYFYAYGVYL